jgi:hypothetical protein
MKTIKTITIALLTILLSSCNAPKVKPVVLGHISIEFNRCRAWCWDINTRSRLPDKRCGDKFESGNYPISYCDGFMGFHEDDWAVSILPWSNDLARWGDDRCK